jgi:acyl carrier protein
VNREDLKTAVLEELSDIAPDIDTAGIDETAHLRDEYDLDSMDAMNLLMALHKRLKINIPEQEYARMKSLAELLDYLERRSG